MKQKVRVAVIVETDLGQANIVIDPRNDQRGIQEIIRQGKGIIRKLWGGKRNGS